MKRSRAFTLIELLTVIAIIAILSAIIFPVFARAKVNAARSSDISGMNQIRTALQLYKVDQGGYPPALLGYVNPYQSGNVGADLLPADKAKGYLFPRRVNSLETFTSRQQVGIGRKEWTTAVWPNADPRAVGQSPVIDTNGDNKVTNADDVAGARQSWKGNQPVRLDPRASSGPLLNFYKLSGYEVAEVNSPAGKRTELHYTLFWTADGINGGSAFDDPRQLGYGDPPENTVITWNSYYRDYENGNAKHEKTDLVLFLGGAARPFDSRDLADRSWRITN